MNFTLSQEQSNDLSNYTSILNLLSGHSVYNLNEPVLASLGSYDNVGGISEKLARSILTYYGHYYPIGYVSSSGTANQAMIENGGGILVNHSQELDQLTVMPNPSSGTVVFSMTSDLVKNAKTLTIINVDGRLVDQWELEETDRVLWDGSIYPDGIYFYQLHLKSGNPVLGKILLDK